MAQVKKLQPKKLIVKKRTFPKSKGSSAGVSLPDSPTKGVSGLFDIGQLIYGETGVGKTTMFAHIGKPFYFRFEISGRKLQLYQTPVINKWEEALAFLGAAERNKKDFTTAIIDTGGPAYDRCLEYKCMQLNISHPGKVKDYGASWKEILKEYVSFHQRLAALDMGVVVVAHESTEEFETRSGQTVTKIIPHFSGRTLDFYRQSTELIGYYFYLEEERYLLIRGSDMVMAKCTLDDHFNTKKGERITCIPMGKSPKQAAENYIAAFNNEQERTYQEIMEKGGFLNTKKTVVKKNAVGVTKKLIKKAALKKS